MTILQPEASIWYAVCWVVVGVRFVSKRMRRGSWRALHIDDYLVVLAMTTLTVLIALLHIIINTSSNLIAPGEDVSKFTPEDIQKRIYGSQLTVVVEQMQITTIWLLKACILIMYGRMTDILRLYLAVKAVAIYVGISFIVMEILWFGVWCRPFSQYWAVPTNSVQCSAMIHHLITNAVLNISSDIMIMAIPLPLIFKVRIALDKKVALGGVFFVGIFAIIAAVKNKYESFMHPFSTQWMIWYLREAFTAVLCANLPLTRPVLQRLFNLRDWTTQETFDSTSGRYGTHSQPSTYRLRGNSMATTVASEHSKQLPFVPPSLSEEYMNPNGGPSGILYETEVRIAQHPAQRSSSDDMSVLEIGKGDGQPRYLSTDGMDRVDTLSMKSRPKSVMTTCYHEKSEDGRGF